MSEPSMETPGEDAAEQDREVPEQDAEQGTEQLSRLPLEVDEADAAEQIRDVGYADEDYR